MMIHQSVLTSPLVPEEFRREDVACAAETIVSLLLEDNALFNLTAITDRTEIFHKHIVDSLIAAKALNEALHFAPEPEIADVGSGAGFPALPIAAALPRAHVTAIDSTSKKIAHVMQTARACGFTTFTVMSARAETLGRDPAYREHYDAVTARAVARLPILTELCLPLVKKGGCLLAMKGETAPQEIADAKEILRTLGGTAESCTEYHIPGDERKRYLVLIRKTGPTPQKYPRPYAQIIK